MHPRHPMPRPPTASMAPPPGRTPKIHSGPSDAKHYKKNSLQKTITPTTQGCSHSNGGLISSVRCRCPIPDHRCNCNEWIPGISARIVVKNAVFCRDCPLSAFPPSRHQRQPPARQRSQSARDPSGRCGSGSLALAGAEVWGRPPPGRRNRLSGCGNTRQAANPQLHLGFRHFRRFFQIHT